jgi:hypothetical protein
MTENRWLPIYYSGFWDVPQAFLTTSPIDDLFFFWRGDFDDELDDWPLTYKVYRVTNVTMIDDMIERRKDYPDLITIKNIPLLVENELVGEVPVKGVIFDPTVRKFVHASVFRLLGIPGVADGTSSQPLSELFSD